MKELCEAFVVPDPTVIGARNSENVPIIGWCKTHNRAFDVCFEIRQAIAAEREACAKIASGDLVPILNDLGADGIKAAVRIAAAIRARGQTTPD